MSEISENVNNTEILNLVWFYIDVEERQPKGPVSVRDIDVLMRTNALDSHTYVWREGLEEWKRIYQVEELRDIVSTTHTEIQESLIKNKIQSAFSNSDVDKVSIENFFFGADGFWHVYNPMTKTWSSQEKKPINIKNGNEETEEEKEKFINNDQQETPPNEEITPITPLSGISPLNGLQVANDFIGKKRKPSEHEHIKSTSTDNIPQDKVNTQLEVFKSDEEFKKLEKKKKKAQKKKEKKKQQWYAAKVNSNVYISGLPKDINESELFAYFSRCGFIRKDQRTGTNKIKIYKDNSGKLKGDALVSFLREESVTMAIDMLNETEIRPGHKIIVQKASFEQKGDYQTREAYKLDHLQRYKLRTDVDRMLGWNEEDEEKGLRIVVLQNMFDPREFPEDPGLRQDLELDIVEECEVNFGQIERFMIFEEHPMGIIKIKFKSPSAAAKCIENLNQRYYNGKLIEVDYWDGKTDYNKFQEDTTTQNKRIEEFGQWLESDGNN